MHHDFMGTCILLSPTKHIVVHMDTLSDSCLSGIKSHFLGSTSHEAMSCMSHMHSLEFCHIGMDILSHTYVSLYWQISIEKIK